MNSKDRVRIALSRQQPDRTPVFASFVPEVTAALCDHLKIQDEYDMQVALGNDMLMSGAGIGNSYYGKGEEYICDWGCRWKYFENSAGRYTTIIEHPLENDTDGTILQTYQIPDPENEELYKPMRELMKKYGESHWICGAITCSIFEAAWYLRGLNNMIIDMAANEGYANALLDKVMEFPLRAGIKYIEEGVDMLWLGDDVGMQSCMLMSPDMWRNYLKPRMAKLISTFKQKNPDISNIKFA